MHEIDKTKLSDQTKFRLYEIKKIENCFINDINQQKAYSKKLSRYVTIFDCIDKILIVLSATTSGVLIISFTSTIGKSAGIVSASFTLIFSLTSGIIKKLLNMTIYTFGLISWILKLKEKVSGLISLISMVISQL